MARFKADVRSFSDAASFIGGRDSKQIAHNTHVVKTDSGFGLRYHNTVVVEWRRNGDVVLRHGGWATVTATERINKALPKPYHLSQHNYEWYVERSARDWQTHKEPFIDGMLLIRGGEEL